ncbi:hypothetical protein DBB36_21440 [Flavobacterium sp. WLB]|uniref:hypothetical protein n=1 Tax=unclassified Flavobacterium TaxID=196869 RepID=UPI0006AB9D80|nr:MULTISPECIES: hypothetical protein [unclassified Flavobacterium]KOP36757.1 hypothetical protein AKO67_17625 [Flavobacterium sp. VMW]OWU91124.1 hypothetical protein APR43_09210 [Flavobacterium sp. NLM]PUU67940.1 hypothetical protein DBB36_21440 [Flavobacterium sp. WLB]
MKKKLEADLISIAHRILKLKNKSDINQLYLETQKLYEKLAILKFVDENFDEVKPTISHSEISSEIETIFEKEEIQTETAAAPAIVEEIKAEETPEVPVIDEVKEEETHEPAIIEEITAEIPEGPITETVQETSEIPVEEKTEGPIAAEIPQPEVIEEVEKTEDSKNNIEELSFTTVNNLNPIPDFKPAFELDTEEIKEEVKEEPKAESKGTPIPIAFEDFGINYADAQFVKVDSFEPVSSSNNDLKEKKNIEIPVLETPKEPKSVSLNEKLAKGFHIDLNDRIAFTKNLFGNSTEDYSRVLNQLLTFDSYAEAKDFIENMVKPDYNNWEGKDDYAERFLGIIEKKFA